MFAHFYGVQISAAGALIHLGRPRVPDDIATRLLERLLGVIGVRWYRFVVGFLGLARDILLARGLRVSPA